MSPEIESLLAPYATVSAKIRALDAAGYKRADIARILGKRYQHVRNVLEEKAPRTPRAAPEPAGMAETGGQAFVHDHDRTYRLEVGKDGSVVLPPEVLKALGTPPGGVIIAELGEETLTLFNSMMAIRQMQALMQKYVPPGVSLVDKLLAERRREVEMEEREAEERRAPRRDD
jgi:hypothetical protein